MEAPFPPFTGRRTKRRDSWSWGPSSREEKKLEIIGVELQKLVKQGLDGVRVFHTFFRHRVAPLAERTWPMWLYKGPTDPDSASPKELPNDEVWSRLDRVLQLKPKEKADGKPRPLNTSVVSKLVCSLLLTLCSFPLCFSTFLILSRLFCRDLMLTSPGHTFQRGRRAWLGRPPRRRRRMPGRRRKPRWLSRSIRRKRRSPGA